MERAERYAGRLRSNGLEVRVNDTRFVAVSASEAASAPAWVDFAVERSAELGKSGRVRRSPRSSWGDSLWFRALWL